MISFKQFLENIKFYETADDIIISYIGSDPKSKEDALDVFKQAFPQYDFETIKDFIMNSVKWDKSIKATHQDKTIGIYLIGDRQLQDVIEDEKAIPNENLDKYKNRIGVEGVALAVMPEYQKQGIGKKLKDALVNMTTANYIFGLQYKSLNNLQNWLKSRRLVAQSFGDEGVYITLQDL